MKVAAKGFAVAESLSGAISCPLCFEQLTPEECYVDGCGEKWNVHPSCYEADHRDPLEGANCAICGATADNFHVSDWLWERVGLGQTQACFKCFRIVAWYRGVRPSNFWEVSLS